MRSLNTKFWLKTVLVCLVINANAAFASSNLERCSTLLNTQSYDAAFEACKNAAEQGHADAQFELGNIYYFGIWLTQDYTEAVRWYRAAAERGLAEAQYNLGVMYSNGYGVIRDYSMAERWYRAAAEQGDLRSKILLGLMLSYGTKIEQNLEEALQLFRTAANYGMADAQYYLGWLLSDELISDDQNVNHINFLEALHWLRRSADQGNTSAMLDIARLYFLGKGVMQDYSETVYWYLQAAVNGSARGQSYLGRMYENGMGVEISLVKAHAWYNISASLGNESGTIARNSVASKMTNEQITQAQALARQCLNSNLTDCGY